MAPIKSELANSWLQAAGLAKASFTYQKGFRVPFETYARLIFALN